MFQLDKTSNALTHTGQRALGLCTTDFIIILHYL